MMQSYELEVGSKKIEIDVWEDGDIEITISQDYCGWNDGGMAIAGDIIIPKKYSGEIVEFLQRHLTPLAPELAKRCANCKGEMKPIMFCHKCQM